MVTYIDKLDCWSQFSDTKRLSGMRNLSYTSRLEMLGLERLETRLLHADLTMCYKIVHNLVDIYPLMSSLNRVNIIRTVHVVTH